MSVKLMTLTYEAHFHDIEFIKEVTKKSTGEKLEKKIKIVASTAKSVTLALSDHANDEGEGAYPSLTTLEDKTELSRMTVVVTLQALKYAGIIHYAGTSKFSTSNYTVIKKKLIEMASWERKSRKKVVKPLYQEDLGSKATLPQEVKPLSENSKAALPEPSFNHQLTNDAEASLSSQPQNTKKGDGVDFMLYGMKLAEEKAAREGLPVDVSNALANFPAECQKPARLIYQKFKLIPPEKPKSGKGGDFALWILGINQILKTCGMYKVSLDVAFDELYKNWNKSPFSYKSPRSFVGPMQSALAHLEIKNADENIEYASQSSNTNSVPNPMPRPLTLKPLRKKTA